MNTELFFMKHAVKLGTIAFVVCIGSVAFQVVATLHELKSLKEWQTQTTAKADAILEAQQQNPVMKYLETRYNRRNPPYGFPVTETAPAFYADIAENELCELIANGGTAGKPFILKAKPILFDAKPETIPAIDPDRKNKYLECGPELLDVIEYGLKAPIESKPWRVVHAYEMSHADPVQWGHDVNPRLEALLLGIWPDQQPLTVWEFNRTVKPQNRTKPQPGLVSGTIFHLRICDGGRNNRRIRGEDW